MKTNFKIEVKPLSVNQVWQGRRFKTPAYKQYEKDCFWFLKGKTIYGEVEVHFKFFVKNYKMVDTDNFIKPLLDIIKKAGLIVDDRFVVRILAEKFKSEKEYTEVYIKKLSTSR